MSQPYDDEPLELSSLPTVVKVQAGIAIGLGVIGIGAALLGLAGALVNVYNVTQGASSMPPGMPGAAGFQSATQTLMMITLPIAVVGNLAGLLLSLAAIAGGGILFMSRRLMPLAWTALACVVWLVIFHVIWPIISGIVSWWVMSDAMSQMVPAGSQAPPFDLGLFSGVSIGVGVLCGLLFSAVRIGFWGWTWVTLRNLARTIADPRDSVLDMD